MNLNITSVAGKKKSEGIRMEYGLALIEYCSFWALLLFLEQGKCQVVYHSIFPLDFFFHNLDEQEKKECAWCKC